MRTFQFPLSCALVLFAVAAAPAELITRSRDAATIETPGVTKSVGSLLALIAGGTLDGDFEMSLLGKGDPRWPLEQKFAAIGIPRDLSTARMHEEEPSLLNGTTVWLSEMVGRIPPTNEVFVPAESERDSVVQDDSEQAVIFEPAAMIELVPTPPALEIAAPQPPDISTLTLWGMALVMLMGGLYYLQQPRKRRVA